MYLSKAHKSAPINNSQSISQLAAFCEPESPKIIQPSSPLSYLQQRLNYAAQLDSRSLYMVENVPSWPLGSLPKLKLDPAAVTHYANCQGESALLAAICQREWQQYQVQISPQQVLVSNGAFHAISLTSQYLYQPSAKILCPAPMLQSVDKLFKTLGYEVLYYSVAANGSWLEAIQQAYATQHTDVLYINVPHNPSGAVIDATEMQAIATFAAKQNLVLLVDLVYDSYVFTQQNCTSPLSFSQDWQQIYVFNSMSKNYGVPGLRIGWVISDAANIDALSAYLEAECVAVCSASQEQAVILLQHGNQALIQRVQENWHWLPSLLAKLPGIQFQAPDGGTQYFVQLPVDDIELFADFMLLHYGLVLVTSGNYVGVNASCIRIPLGMTPSTLQQAVALLAQGLEISTINCLT